MVRQTDEGGNVANKKQFMKVLVDAKLSDAQLALLKIHYHAPDHRITMTQLAKAVGYKNYAAANLQYGQLGKKISKFLDEDPEDRFLDGSPFWLSMLAEGWKNNSGEWEFQMWSELVDALEELSLV